MKETDEHDPDASVWRAVGELELKGYTKEEIRNALRRVASSIQVPYTDGDD